jgi:hypothetical protein
MELIFRFLDKKYWSFYGTLNVFIPLILFIIFQQIINLEALIFMSLIGMMDGDLLSKILFTGFLNFLVYCPSYEWVIRSLIFVISVCIIDNIKLNNPVHKKVMESELLQWLLTIIITIWMLYIFYILYISLKFKNNNIYKWKI